MSGIPGARWTEVAGWGGATASRAMVRRVRDAEELRSLLASASPRGVLARGSGLSYGDAAQNAGGLVLDTTGMRAIDDSALDRGEITAEAGATMWDITRRVVPRGWMLSVVPGTRCVTVGGAVAADVHGKSHHRDGSWSHHCRSVRLLTGSGEVHRLDVTSWPDAFGATMGGLGLTGVVLDATMSLVPVETAWVTAARSVTRDLDETLAQVQAAEAGARYCIAWLDLLAPAGRAGRAVIDSGEHARRGELPPRRAPLALGPPPVGLRVPSRRVPRAALVRRDTVRAANALRYALARRGPATRLERLETFFWPLDGLPGWSRLHGPRGLVQYQVALPGTETALLRRIAERLARAPLCPSLVTLKTFGDRPAGPLAFPRPGFTLAVDLPAATPGLARLLGELDEAVAGAGGRVYLTKDARLRPDVLQAMYPRLPEWREARTRLDPGGTMQSDLARRLALT